MPTHLRVARPVSDLARTRDMYCRGLGLRVVGSFKEHHGFDGVMLGVPGASYHFEFTHSRNRLVSPTPTIEDLVVFYILHPVGSGMASNVHEHAGCRVQARAGVQSVLGAKGRTYEDFDGYRVVLQRAEWRNAAAP